MPFLLLAALCAGLGFVLRRFTTPRIYSILGIIGKLLTVVLMILFIRDPYRVIPYDGPTDLLYGMFAKDTIGFSKSVTLFFKIEVLYYIVLLFGLRGWNSDGRQKIFFWSVIYPFCILLSLGTYVVMKMVVMDVLNFW